MSAAALALATARCDSSASSASLARLQSMSRGNQSDRHLATSGRKSLASGVASALALCLGSTSFGIHIAILLGLIEAPWTWDVLLPIAFGSFVVAGAVAAWRGRNESIWTRYDVSVQRWRPGHERLAKGVSLYSVLYCLAFIAMRLALHGETLVRFSQALAASHSGALLFVAAAILSAYPA